MSWLVALPALAQQAPQLPKIPWHPCQSQGLRQHTCVHTTSLGSISIKVSKLLSRGVDIVYAWGVQLKNSDKQRKKKGGRDANRDICGHKSNWWQMWSARTKLVKSGSASNFSRHTSTTLTSHWRFIKVGQHLLSMPGLDIAFSF